MTAYIPIGALPFPWLFVLLLPLGLLSEFAQLAHPEAAWLTVPFSALISWVFVTMEMVGDILM